MPAPEFIMFHFRHSGLRVRGEASCWFLFFFLFASVSPAIRCPFAFALSAGKSIILKPTLRVSFVLPLRAKRKLDPLVGAPNLFESFSRFHFSNFPSEKGEPFQLRFRGRISVLSESLDQQPSAVSVANHSSCSNVTPHRTRRPPRAKRTVEALVRCFFSRLLSPRNDHEDIFCLS